jgi:sec-independent protein translocase protein TatA
MLSNIGPLELTIVLVIVLAIFGTKRLRTLGSDLGSAVKGFRTAVSDADKETTGQLDDKSRDRNLKDADFDDTPVEETRKEERK